ncbi:MAG: radical SAM protein [Desulfosalsimonadaceae bacterium]
MIDRLNHLEYYRLPWNYTDNGISWLEPTNKCNLRCEGCYRDPKGDGHKTLEEVRADLEVFKKFRKSDCISIAGGDPLVYPHIVEVVRMVKEMGWKPIINTNGLALDESLLEKLKKAGAFGFTFHIDTTQDRPGAAGKTEAELNELRLHFAEMLHRAGDFSCSFNSTVSEKTLHEIPDLINWAQKHADIAHTMVFILYRSPNLTDDFDLYANGEKINIDAAYKITEWGGAKTLMAADAVEKIREADPMYEPAAYLNGTASPDSLKWLLAGRIIFNGQTMGYVSPKFMELVQTFNHIFTGTYLAYENPKRLALGKLSSFLAGFFDKKMRKIFFNILKQILKNSSLLFKPARLQSIMIIQPVNFEKDGRQDMCDGCPDMTVHEGKLQWSCRLEEVKKYGSFMQTVPKK